MKLYGYQAGSDEESPITLEEVTLSADPATLRKLAAFLLHAADAMDRWGAAFGHEHFEDFDGARDNGPALIVTRTQLIERE